MHPFDNVIPSVWSAHGTYMPIFSTGHTVLKKSCRYSLPILKLAHFHCLKFLIMHFFLEACNYDTVNSEIFARV